MKRVTKKDKRRLIVLMIIFIPLLTLFLSNMFSYWSNIYKKKKLDEEYALKLEKEELLKSEIQKLQDEEYVARYAREKYLYSKEGEIIIKID